MGITQITSLLQFADTARRKARSLIRTALAALFWLHAIGITHLANIKLNLGPRTKDFLSEVVLLSVIFFYSFLGSNGWWSLLGDLGYIYLWPFWLLAKHSWKFTKATTRPILKKLLREAGIVEVEEKKPSIEADKKKDLGRLSVFYLLRPFKTFATLWCAIILLDHNDVLTALCVMAVLANIAKVSFVLNRFLDGPLQWANKFQNAIQSVLKTRVEQVLNADFSSEKGKQEVNALMIYRAVLKWMTDRAAIQRFVQSLALTFAIPYYLYISILSGFAYLGIAHLEKIPWSAQNALVDALCMPLAWEDLPHSVVIRLLAFLQVALLAYIGYEAIIRKMSRKAEEIAKSAEKVAIIIYAPELDEKISQAKSQNTENATP